MFPGTDKYAQDLLLKLLMFDVDKRITVDQALEHPYMKAVRDPAHERAKKPRTFSLKSRGIGCKKARALILVEVAMYRQYDELVVGYCRRFEKEYKSSHPIPHEVMQIILQKFIMLPMQGG